MGRLVTGRPGFPGRVGCVGGGFVGFDIPGVVGRLLGGPGFVPAFGGRFGGVGFGLPADGGVIGCGRPGLEPGEFAAVYGSRPDPGRFPRAGGR